MNTNRHTPALQHSDTPIVLSGLGMVTPLGWQTDQVWQRLCAGESGIRSTISSPSNDKSCRCARVEGFNLDDILRTSRTRRSSSISHFAVGATALALRDAQLSPHSRVGVIVAVSMGGVAYTRHFHLEFVQGGARNASPMLFPETVFNAPASHISAVFGLTDVNYTVIGDSASSATALTMATDLISAGVIDQCLVVATDEMDWITLEGFTQFGLVSPSRGGEASIRPFDRRRNGFLGGEGAVAVLLESDKSAASRGAMAYARLASCDRGFPFLSRHEMTRALQTAIECGLTTARIQWRELGGVIASANGTFVDHVEATALARVAAASQDLIPVTSLKSAIGESHTTSCLFQIAAGMQAMRSKKLPPTVGTAESILDSTKFRLVANTRPLERDALLVLCVGFNEQVSVVVLAAA